jgi:nucleoid-associated protein YgaU
MQRIERYGVIALVFLLVTIVAVSLWGEQRKAGGLFHFLKRDSKSAQVDRLVADLGQDLPPSTPAATRGLEGRTLPLSEPHEDLPVPRAKAAPPPLVSLESDLFAEQPVVDGPVVPPAEVPQLSELPRPQPPVETRPLVPTPAPSQRPAPVAATGPRRYTVRAGETLGEIAQRELGSVKQIPRIVALNAGLDPDRVLAGQVLLLPAEGADAPAPRTPAAVQEARPVPSVAAAAPSSTRRYTVRAGDTLSQIAVRELGTTARMAEIEALNAGLDPDRVLAGQVLLLPADAGSSSTRVAAAARPAAAPRRSRVQ